MTPPPGLPLNARSFCRTLLLQGGDLWCDHMDANTDVYVARVDAVAAARADELNPHLLPPSGGTPAEIERLVDEYGHLSWSAGAGDLLEHATAARQNLLTALAARERRVREETLLAVCAAYGGDPNDPVWATPEGIASIIESLSGQARAQAVDTFIAQQQAKELEARLPSSPERQG